MIRPILAATLLLASAGVAHAEPWRTDSLSLQSGTVYSASVLDAEGDYALVVECKSNGAFNIWIESPFDWDVDASYAPEVPTVFLIDGTEISDVMFQFDSRQLGEGIVAYSKDQPAAFENLLTALRSAADGIGFSYFDRTATFTAEGSSAAILFLQDSCH